jgi:hypothetical protein
MPCLLDKKQGDTNSNSAISNIKDRKRVVTQVKMQKVYNGPESDTINNVAQSPADDKTITENLEFCFCPHKT